MSYAYGKRKWLGPLIPIGLAWLTAYLGLRFLPRLAERWDASLLLGWIGGLVAVAGYLGAVRLAMTSALKAKSAADLSGTRRVLAAMATAEFLYVCACAAVLMQIGGWSSGTMQDDGMRLAASWTAAGTLIVLLLHLFRAFAQMMKWCGAYSPNPPLMNRPPGGGKNPRRR